MRYPVAELAGARLERLAARAGEVVRLDCSRLLPAEYHFNPSLAVSGGHLWMAYRCVTPDSTKDLVDWPRRLGLCRLNAALQPDPDSNVDLTARIEDPEWARRWHADPRFFVRGEEPWLSYHDNHDLLILPLDPARLPPVLRPQQLELVGRTRRERERNWGFFDDGDFKAIYTIDPLVVTSVTHSGIEFEASPLYETAPVLPWDQSRWGEPHGGTSPVLVGSCWFSFFQSSRLVRPDSEQKVYVVGFYGFDARPPHRVRYMTARPILDGFDLDGEHSFWRNFAVAYPSGAIFNDGMWLVSIGIHDRAIGLVAFRHDELLDGCVEVSPPVR